MRTGRTHAARASGKRSAARRGAHRWRAQAPAIALCALGAGVLVATTYGLLHQPAPQTSAGAQAPTIAAKDNKADAGSAGINAATKEQAARKDDGLITGSLPKKQDITAPAADAKTAPQAAKKKPATATAKTETQKNLFDFFNNGQPRR